MYQPFIAFVLSAMIILSGRKERTELLDLELLRYRRDALYVL